MSGSQRLRVLSIGASDRAGGAAIAADRLNRNLPSFGVYVHSLVAHKVAKDGESTSVNIALRSRKARLAHKFALWIQDWSGLQYSFLPIYRRFILAKARAFKADVIHLHNIHAGVQGFFQTDLIADLSRIAPVVWTLHDMWALTGHCAYAMGCDRWLNGCGSCPDIGRYPAVRRDTTRHLWNKKRAIYQRSDLTFVTPSKWLAGLCEAGAVADGNRLACIPNGIDLSLFSPGDGHAKRQSLSIPDGAPTLIFAAERVGNNPRKGGAALKAVVERLNARATRPIHVILVGGGDLPWIEGLDRIVPHPVGYIGTEAEIVRLYRAADLFLFPTEADNLPNTLVEAIACGLPAATFDVGGCGEIIEDQVNGLLGSLGAPESLADRILMLLEDTERLQRMSTQARAIAEARFDVGMMAGAYHALFVELMRRRVTES